MRLSDIMGNTPGLTIWPEIALVMFVVIFAGVVFKTFAKSQQQKHEEARYLPLEDDEGRKNEDEVNSHAQA